MKYIVMSIVQWDSIFEPGGKIVNDVSGGAGVYALSGMKIWTDAVGIVSGVGADYLSAFGSWYKRNQISTEGLSVLDPHSPRNMIRYKTDDDRLEISLYGREHFRKLEPQPRDLIPFLSCVEGVYIFQNARPSFWDQIRDLKKRYGFRIMWEISSDAAKEENLDRIRMALSPEDIFSINRTEMARLSGADSVQETISFFLETFCCSGFLRDGKMGSYVISNGQCCFIPSCRNINVVDPTGGGNSSTGGAFIGFCKNLSLERIGAMANVSAAICIEQFGVPPRIDSACRMRAKELMNEILSDQEWKYVKK